MAGNRDLGKLGVDLVMGNAAQFEKFKTAIQDLSIASGKSTANLAQGMCQVVSAYGSGADASERLRIVTDYLPLSFGNLLRENFSKWRKRPPRKKNGE